MKVSKFYLTSTLLNAWLGGYDSFLDTLYRRETETTPQMEKGKQFEIDVLNREYEELVPLLDGALYQTFLYRPINDYVAVLGYSDFINFDTIYDTKSVSNYDCIGKYKKSGTQHLIYPFCADMEKFEYIIEHNKNIYYEGYLRDDKKLFEIVNQFLFYLKITNQKDIFEQNFNIERKIDVIKEHYKV